jgi:hypothetical protein
VADVSDPRTFAGLRRRREALGLPVGGDGFDGIREAISDLHARWGEAADSDCTICHGGGMTRGYAGPGKTATYPCPCTGMREVS